MWHKLIPRLHCPVCRNALAGFSLDGKRPVEPRAGHWIETGLLTCSACMTWFPIVRGVPVLLPYSTPAHRDFTREHATTIAGLAPDSHPPSGVPVTGEQLVMQSFSTEWLEYDFDGVIWEMDYEDHERRFLAELGDYAPSRDTPGWFLEVGCGLGITTAMAQRNFGGDAVGVDLSLAAWRAAATHRANPSVHFVQASVFALPFAAGSFDTIYTRGVLHHTYSTSRAYSALVPLCRPGGSLYVWVYGPRSINDNAFRRMVYGTEVVMRFVLNRSPAWVSTPVLAPLAVSYMLFNWMRRQRNPRIRPYNYTRALHAARDRYTPEFAHRHDVREVCRWFHEAGCMDVQAVDWRDMPSADHDDYRRNTGVRGRRAAAACEQDVARDAGHGSGEGARVRAGERQDA